MPEVSGAGASSPERPPARRRLWRLLSVGGPTSVRTQLIVAVLVAVLGFAAVAQVRLTRIDDDFSGQRREDLIELLDSLSAASDRARSQIEELERTRDDLLSSSERRQKAFEESSDRLDVLEILTGTVAAEGPGVTITIGDPAAAVTAATLLDAVEELRDAGAEAIEIQDLVRVVASTSFTATDGVVHADGVELRPPYVIDVIGSADTLSDAVTFPGGLQDQVAEVDGTVKVEQADVVQVGSVHTIDHPDYTQPTGR